MPYNGSGTFNRVYNWVTDKNNSINITASRVDTEDTGFATGLSNAICKDGQTTITANLPMSSFIHTGVGNASARNHYAVVGGIQDSLYNWIAGGGTADAITATYSPAVTALVDGMELNFRATAANATTTPTFSPNGLTARTITKKGGSALVAGDISAALFEGKLRYNLANTRWELSNPAVTAPAANTVTNAMLAQMAANTVKGNNTGSLANATDIALTASTLLGMGSSGNIAALTATAPLSIGANAITFNASQIANSLSGDVALNNTANYFDGPTVAQGSSGTWLAIGTVTLFAAVGAGGLANKWDIKLWDGTTVIASGGYLNPSDSANFTVTLIGFLATPTGNLRISVKNETSTGAKILSNYSGNSKDSTITAIRIG